MKDGSIVQVGTAEEILMSPANDYVERFVEDVDLSEVLTASHLTKRAEITQVDRGCERGVEARVLVYRIHYRNF